jgi:diguanylate cyclase (GGDEF)-like protein/PAS domain S-box-containing protein
MNAEEQSMSRASDPLAATAPSDPNVQRFTSALGSHFSFLTADNLSPSMHGALQMLADFADVDSAFATLIDHDRVVDVWEWARPGVKTAPPEAGWQVDRAFGAGAQLMRRGMAIPVGDIGMLAMDPELSARFAVTEFRSLALVPVRRQDELVGVVGLLTSGRYRDWSADTIRQLDVFGDVMLTAVLRVRYAADLAVADARMRRIADLVPDALLFVGDEGRITWASRSAAVVLGRTPEGLLGRRPTELVHPEYVSELQDAVQLVRDGATLPPVRCRVRIGIDEYRWCEVSLSYSVDGTDGTAGMAGAEMLLSVRDTHESRLEAERLASSATTDQLTGALNRAGLRNLLEGLVERSLPLAVAFCDLDGFKQVNDQLGHKTGDAVLMEVAALLRQASRPTDALARLGGDEFVVVLPGLRDRERAAQLAERMVRAIAGPDGRTSVTVSGDPLGLPLSLSVGVALSPAPTSAEVLLEAADAAMYEAKREGKNRWSVTAV